MRHFHDMFGDGPTPQLSSTFRCAPTICETAGRFVTKNPSQLTKTVRSAQDRPGGPVRLIGAQGLDDYLGAPSGRVADHEFGAPLSVMLLGRYQHNRQLMPNAE